MIRYAMQTNPARRQYKLPELSGFAEVVDENTWFEIAPDQKIVLRDTLQRDGTVKLIARGRELAIKGLSPDSIRSMLHRTGRWQPREILSELDDVDWEHLRPFLQQLFDSDIVRLVEL